jgi:Cu(I)/Ag(I) efflux system membrane protein CusA/SilA
MTLLDRIIRFFLENRLIAGLLLILFITWGIMVAPFDWNTGSLPRNPVPVDAIPDIGDNQQIVFTEWMGRSPQDIEDQITYPLTVSLLGLPGVKTIRSFSMFGFSSIYIIFEEDVEFYWSRSRILEKLNSLSAGMLPHDVKPSLGPDATALGQVFWYTLEGQDASGNATGGWDIHELRSIQDWYVRYALMSAEGVSEVASVGGFVQEYQIDVDPNAMRVLDVSIEDVVSAIKMSNIDVGARSIEINSVEYVIRGVGFVKSIADIENAVIKMKNNVPVYIRNIAHVATGPALRRGALDKGGAEVVGGVVVVRHGDNPLEVINTVKEKISEISPGLPKKTLDDGTVSQVKIVPFYDRSKLIYETLGTLNTALTHEILITIIVVLIMMLHLRSSLLISGLLPVSVLMVFIAMKQFAVDANIVALSGIAIAIGTMVDLGIIISENIVRHLEESKSGDSTLDVIFRAVQEVGTAVLTAVSTTIISFLPVFTLQAAEGKLFRPLAFTKTFALISAAIVALTIIPSFAHMLFSKRARNDKFRSGMNLTVIILGFFVMLTIKWWLGFIVICIGLLHLFKNQIPIRYQSYTPWIVNGAVMLSVIVMLSRDWLPLGPENGMFANIIFVSLLIGVLLFLFQMFIRLYGRILSWALNHKGAFLSLPLTILIMGLFIWLGFDTFFGWLPRSVKSSTPVSYISHKFPGLGKEFMPPLDEGSFLLMPTTMPHASIGEVLDVLQKQDMAINAIPEVSLAVGKLGRAESALDPAPVSMIETVINYHSEFVKDDNDELMTYKFKRDSIDFARSTDGVPLLAPDGGPYLTRGAFIRDQSGALIPDDGGKPFRVWRPALDPNLNEGRTAWVGIRNSQDIWDQILDAADIPGTTSAPLLQPIAARIVMLQSGMRAPLGIKIKGPDLDSIEKAGIALEQMLKQVPRIDPTTVIADRIVGKPYLEIHIDRLAIARYGIRIKDVQNVIEIAIGGKPITMTIEGRERYPVRVRYMRELRDTIESLERILIPAPDGAQIPLGQLAKIIYVRGPQMIKSEDTFLVGYVIFDRQPGVAEVDVVEQAKLYLQEKSQSGELNLGPGVTYTFAGSYENQVRAQKRLSIILPLVLFAIFIILYFQFRSVAITALVFSGIAVAWAGGFILIWLYGQSWFMDITLFDIHFQELFQIRPFNLSVAVWVGFIALFGIATDAGVVIATYLKQSFQRANPDSVTAIREATMQAGLRRVRPAVMTVSTTILALIAVLTATGRGADIMIPMAIPVFGGMLFELINMFIVPVLFSAIKERYL